MQARFCLTTSNRDPGKQRASRASHFRDRTDYEHRHFVNLAATAFILALAFIIGWTVKAFDSQRALEKCLDSGRKDCVKVTEDSVRSFIKLGK